MWPHTILLLALATALSGVPSMASVPADGAAAEPSLDGTTVTVAAAAAAVTIGGLVLLAVRRRAGNRMSPATAEKVTAVLTRRTLHRGRLRLDDEVMSGPRQAPSRASRPRAKRRTG